MYMHRTQIYLDDEEATLLAAATRRTGASRSELIRRAVRAQYGESTPAARLAALRASAGAWGDRSQTGADYVDEMRTGLSERMSQIGLR